MLNYRKSIRRFLEDPEARMFELLERVVDEAILLSGTRLGGGIRLYEQDGSPGHHSVWKQIGRTFSDPHVVEEWQSEMQNLVACADPHATSHCPAREEHHCGDTTYFFFENTQFSACTCDGFRKVVGVDVLARSACAVPSRPASTYA
jgi:hypothetical protein